MPAFKDLVGKKFGKWTVLEWDSVCYAQQFWLCRCECGTEKLVIGGTLKRGLSKSCGCAGKDWCRTHGRDGTKIYNTWAAMLQRCNNPKSRNFKNYGGRGIKVCERWHKFENFLADMGEQADGFTIDRFPDNNGDYEPSNCRWATVKQQANNRRTNVYLEYNGQKKSISEWADIVGIKRKIIENRIRMGWDVRLALEKPSRNKKC